MTSVKRRKFSEDVYFKSQEKIERSSNSTISFKASKSH